MKKFISKILICLLVALFFPATPMPVPVHAARAAVAPVVCSPGNLKSSPISGDPPVESLPTFSYSADGLLEFHFLFKPGGFALTGPSSNMGYGHYGPDCSYVRGTGIIYSYSASIPSQHRVMARATPTGPDSYNFRTYDEDTGELIPNAFSAMPPDFSGDEIISMSFSSAGWYGGADEYAINVVGFTTPAVPVKQPPAPEPPPAPARTPVLIVPGILGTEIFKENSLLWPDPVRMLLSPSDDFMDPLAFDSALKPSDPGLTIGSVIKTISPLGNFKKYDYTEGLVNEFKSRGYVEDADLFVFPYDWRAGVDKDTVTELGNKIEEILNRTGADKVDIVAHSTGGLLVKKFVQETPDPKIDKAVFVGVPNLGAPKAVKALVAGDSFGVPLLSEAEIQKISSNMPVAYDLLPAEKYFSSKGSYVRVVERDDSGKETPKDLDWRETANFLATDHNLNQSALDRAGELHKLDFDNLDMRDKGVDVFSIAGCKSGTLGKIMEIREADSKGTVFSYGRPDFVPGDGTVPLESATNMPVNADQKYFALRSDHGKMLSQPDVSRKIADLIAGGQDFQQVNSVTQDISRCKLKGKALSIYSPVNITVTDQEGNALEDIPNADFEVFGDHKFVFLPEDEGQSYSIELTGSGTGTFTLQVDDIDDGETAVSQIFPAVPVTPSFNSHLDINGSQPLLTVDNSCN